MDLNIISLIVTIVSSAITVIFGATWVYDRQAKLLDAYEEVKQEADSFLAHFTVALDFMINRIDLWKTTDFLYVLVAGNFERDSQRLMMSPLCGIRDITNIQRMTFLTNKNREWFDISKDGKTNREDVIEEIRSIMSSLEGIVRHCESEQQNMEKASGFVKTLRNAKKEKRFNKWQVVRNFLAQHPEFDFDKTKSSR